MSRVIKMAPILALCALIIAVPSVWANWVQDGVAVCTATRDQGNPGMVPDGAGGAIVAWVDFRDGGPWRIYAQRVDAAGTILWTTDGVALCAGRGKDWQRLQIASDGAGGAIATWEDSHSGNHQVYAQRVNASGAAVWTTDGVSLCAAAGDRYDPQVISDGEGGAIVTWHDARSGIGKCDIYAQRVSANGTAQWAEDGVLLCAARGDQLSPTIASDGVGGAIVAWQDLRTGKRGHSDVYAQRVNAAGSLLWATDGVAICTAAGDRCCPQVTADGTGGVIVTWDDKRGGNYGVYAQRVDASGAPLWAANGVPVCTAKGFRGDSMVMSDGVGGAIVTWADARGAKEEIYVQRVTPSGSVLWTADGVAVCRPGKGREGKPATASDGRGGIIVAWISGDYHIWIQKVNASGGLLCGCDGIALCKRTTEQFDPAMVSDGVGGAIVAWGDSRNANYAQSSDIYVQRINAGDSCSSNKR